MSEGLNRIPMLLSVVFGLILSVVPLPHWLNIARPDFLVIVVLYWSIMVPRAGGLMLAFFAGLLLDAFKGVVLGQHALALCLASYVAIKLHLRVRIFPVLHQALTVFWLLALYQFMYAMTAAHKTLPLPCYVQVTNLRNGRSVVVRVNDRGPFVANRLIDLSYSAATRLDMDVLCGASRDGFTAFSKRPTRPEFLSLRPVYLTVVQRAARACRHRSRGPRTARHSAYSRRSRA